MLFCACLYDVHGSKRKEKEKRIYKNAVKPKEKCSKIVTI
jgi:hypothetical protein